VLELGGNVPGCASWLQRASALVPSDAGMLTRLGALHAAQVHWKVHECMVPSSALRTKFIKLHAEGGSIVHACSRSSSRKRLGASDERKQDGMCMNGIYCLAGRCCCSAGVL
jgi:hypothetical protein